MARHFLTGAELSSTELGALIDRALELKADPLSCAVLRGRTVALVFQRPSTRTRVSFEVGIAELGGHPMVLRTEDLQLTRGELLQRARGVMTVPAGCSVFRIRSRVRAGPRVPRAVCG